MCKISFFGLVLILLFSSACNLERKPTEQQSFQKEEGNVDSTLITSTLRDSEGNELEMAFNNDESTVIVIFNNETIELKSQNPASGIWYKNELYELRGKAEEIELTKDGVILFKID